MAFDAQKYLDSREEERKKLPKGDFSAGSYLRKRKSELKREYEDAGYEGTFNDYLKEHNMKLLRSHGLDTPEDEQFKSYIKRAGSFAYRMAKERRSREGKYTSAQDFGGYRDAANAEMEELDKIAKSLKGYYEKYGDIYVRDVGDALSLLGESAGSLGKVKSALDEELNYWSRFKTEDDYKQAIAGERERERLSSLNLDTIDRQIDALEGRLSRAAEEEQAASDAYARLASGVGSLSEQAAMGESYKKALDSTGEDFKFKRDRWKSELNALKRERDAAYRIQKEKEAEAYRANPEFSKYVRAGTGNENSRLKSGNEAYEHLSAVERDTYNYLLGRDGEQTADRYLKTLEEALNYRLGTSRAQGMEEQPVLQYLYSPYAGLDQFASGISQLFSEDALPTSAVQFQSAAIREDIAARDGAFGSGVYDMGTTVGNMAPSLLVSVVTAGLGAPAAAASAVGSLSLGASAGGNAYNAARKQGYGVEDARNYALLIGASEGALQYALGGIGKLGGKMLSQPVRTAISNIDNAMLRVAADMGVSMASEGFEEYLQTVLEPVFRNVALGEENEVELWSEDAAYSFLMGAITAGLIEGPAQAARGFSTAKRGKAVFASGNDVNLVNSALSLDPGTEAYKLARKLDDGAAAKSNAAMGELLSAYKRDGGDLGFMREPRPRRDEAAPGDTPPAKAAPVANAAAKTAAGVQSDIRVKDSVNAGDIGYNEIPARRNIMAGDNAPMRPEAQNAQAGDQSAHTPINTVGVANMPQRAVATAAKAVFNGSGADAEVTGVAAVEDGRVYVSLSDGGTALAGDVSFDDPGLDRLYASASVFDTPGARAFVSGYDGSVDVGAYYSGFASIYGAARKGMTQRQAVNGSLYAQSLPPEARQIAYFAGQNAGKLADAKTPASAAANTAPQAAQTIRRPAPDAAGDGASASKGTAGHDAVMREGKPSGPDAGKPKTHIEREREKVKKVAARLRVKVEFADLGYAGNGAKIQGEYRGGVIRIDNRAADPVMTVFKHELTHFIEKSEFYGEFCDYVEQLVNESGRDAKSVIKGLAKERGISEEAARREMAAIFAQDKLFSDERAINALARRKPTIAQRILNWIRIVIGKLKGTEEAAKLQRAEKLYARAYADAIRSKGKAGVDSEPGDGGRFSINPSFEREYDAWNGKDPKGFFVVGSTSKALQSIGIGSQSIQWDKSKIIKIKEKHSGMTDFVIKQVPSILEQPIVIMQSKQADSRVVLFGEVFDANHVPVLAVIELQPKVKQKFGLEVLKIASAYGKDTNPQKLINESKILYVEPDKNRTNRWLEGTRLQLPFNLKNYGSIDKIAYSDASVNNSIRENGENDAQYSIKYDMQNRPFVEVDEDILNGVPRRDWVRAVKLNLAKKFPKGVIVGNNTIRIDKQSSQEMTYSKYTRFLLENFPELYADKLRATNNADEIIQASRNYVNESLHHPRKDNIQEFARGIVYLRVGKNDYRANVVVAMRKNGQMLLYDILSMEKMRIEEKAGRSKSAKLQNEGTGRWAASNDSISRGDTPVNPSIRENGENDAQSPDGLKAEESTGTRWDELIKAYGAIERGENPAREIETPAKTSDRWKTRRFVRTVLESDALPDSMVAEIKESVISGAMSYTPVSDEAALSYARNMVDEKNQALAWREWEAIVSGKEAPGKKGIAVGELLLRSAARNGDAAAALKLSGELSEVLTRAGQTVQAARLLKKSTGVGKLYYMQQVVATLNRELEKRYENSAKKYRVKINESLAERLLQAGTDAERNAAVADIVQDMAYQTPVTWADKWNAWRYLSMLGNPRTHIRNILGNAVFYPAVKMKNALAFGLEHIFLHNGGRTKAPTPGTELKTFAARDYEEVRELIISSGKLNPLDQVRDKRTMFNVRWLEKIRKTNFNLLEKEDALFLRRHYTAALAGYLKANGVELAALKSEGGMAALEKARTYAILEAQKATYRDASAMANVLSRLSHGGNTKAQRAFGVFVESVLPFKQTPINILKRGVEYSPAGLIKQLSLGVYQLKTGKITPAQFIDGIAAGLTGTAIMSLGMFLKSLGVVQGGLGDDKEDYFNKLKGEQAYSLKIGDMSYTIDWMAPMSLPFFVGVELQSAVEGEWENATFADVAESIALISEPMLNFSMMQGLNDMLDSISFSDNKLLAILMQAANSYVQQGLPTIGGQIARTADGTARRAYADKNSGVPTDFSISVQQMMKKIPGLSYALMPSVNEWGEIRSTEDIAERAAANFISPGFTSRLETDSVEEEIGGVYDATGDNGVLPSMAPKYFMVNGERKDLTAEEYTSFSVQRGQSAHALLEAITSDDAYKRMDDEQKADVIKKTYEYADKTAKSLISDYELAGWIKEIANEAEATGAAPEAVGRRIVEKVEEIYAKREKQEDVKKLLDLIGSGDHTTANDIISRYEGDAENLKRNITKLYKTRIIELYEEGDESGVDELTDALAGLELYDKDGEPYYNADKIWGWIEGHEEDQQV